MNWDISTIGILLSILTAIILSNSFVKEIVKSILLVAAAIDKHETDIEIREILKTKKAKKPDLVKRAEIVEKSIDSFNKSLTCNITLFFWLLTFLFILIIAHKTNLYAIKNEEIIGSLAYITLIPYLYSIIWSKLDGKSQISFLNELNNKTSSMRYPVTFFAGITTFQFLLNNSAYLELIKPDFPTLTSIISLLVFISVVANISIRIYRVYSINSYETNRENIGKDNNLYFLGVWNEVFSLILSIIISFIISLILIYFLRIIDRSYQDFISVMLITTFPIFAILITYRKLFTFGKAIKFLTRNSY